jgi:hypothetical protein
MYPQWFGKYRQSPALVLCSAIVCPQADRLVQKSFLVKALGTSPEKD